MFNRISKRNVELSPAPWDHHYSEYFPSSMNVEADWQSRNLKDHSEWELLPQVFQTICHIKGKLEIDLFASRLSAQVTQYIAWKPDPYSQGTDTMQQICSNQYLYAFPPFSMINKILKKIAQDQVKRTLIVASTCQSQVWYPTLLRMSLEKPLLLPHHPHLLLNHQAQIHPLITNKTLKLAVWTVSGKGCLQQELQRGLPNLVQAQGDKVYYQITIRPDQSGLAGVVKEKLIHFDVL